jgi:hypothetical protein
MGLTVERALAHPHRLTDGAAMKIKKQSSVTKTPKDKPAIVTKGKLDGRSNAADSCANCAGSRSC